jgi:general secretion pathway protein G
MAEKKKSLRKKSITLIEILVVIALIGIITGALAYNYQGSIQEGKAFKSRELKERIKTIVALDLAEHPEHRSTIDEHWETYVKKSPLWSDKNKGDVVDGWGRKYQVHVEDKGSVGDFVITVTP